MNESKPPKKGGSRIAPKEAKPPKKKPAEMTPEELKRHRDTMVKRLVLVSTIILAVVLAIAAVWTTNVRPPEGGQNTNHLVPNTTKKPENPDNGDETIGEELEESHVGYKDGYYTFLVLGTDASDAMTDTIMLVTYDTTNNKAAVMSIPRDTMVNVSWDIKRINSVYSVLGLDKLKEHIAKTTGIYPDYHILVDLTAFADLVDTIGGVEFDVPVRMYHDDPTQNLLINLQPGVQKLDGEHAMHVARFRGYAAGDIQRIQVQQDLISAIIKQTLNISNVTKVKEFADIFAEKVDTNLTVGNIVWLGTKALNIQMEDISFHTLPGNYGAWQYSYNTKGNQSIVLPYGDEILELVNEYMNPYTRDLTKSDLSLMYKNSDGSFGVTNASLADKRAAVAPPNPNSGSTTKDDPKEETPEESEPPEETNPSGEETTPPVTTENPDANTEPTTPPNTTQPPEQTTPPTENPTEGEESTPMLPTMPDPVQTPDLGIPT